jgi:hypothetical protein
MQEVVAQFLGLEIGLDHREERLAPLILERDRHLALDRAAAPLGGRHRMVEHQTMRPVDLGEHADLDIGLLALHPHRVDRRAADADVGLTSADDPSVLALTVQLLLGGRIDEGIEDDLRWRVVQPLETQLVAHVPLLHWWAGGMFWLRWNRLSGSYRALIATSRSQVSPG